MPLKIRKSILLGLSIIPVFILPVFYMDFKVWLGSSIVLLTITILSLWRFKDLFSTLLFFTLIHISRPLNYEFTNLIGIEFAGTFFLIPILIFTILILTLPRIRQSVSWWKRDTLDRKSLYLIFGLAFISGISLWVWGNFIAKDLTLFLDNFPEVPLIWILINGIGFAILNAIAEEYLARGMLCNGLEKIFTDKRSIIIIQAVIFSIFHYSGFPGGIIGMIMVFAWSIVLGIIRYRTKGMLGVLIAHFFADLTIYFILYSLK